MKLKLIKSVAITIFTLAVLSDKAVAAGTRTVSGGDSISSGNAVIQENVSGGDLLVIDEEEIALADMPMVEFEETVNGVTIRLSAVCDAFEEGTEMVVKELDPVESVIAKAEQENQTIIQRCRVFDIILVKDGEEVQPLNDRTVEVTFEGEMILPTEGECVSVYHVGEEEEITAMDAVVVNADTTQLSMMLQ